MFQIYQHGLLRSVGKMFEKENDYWILRGYGSRLCSTFKVEKKTETMDWSANYLDANPIKNLWSLIKKKLIGHLSRHIREIKIISQRICRKMGREEYVKKAQSYSPQSQEFDNVLK